MSRVRTPDDHRVGYFVENHVILHTVVPDPSEVNDRDRLSVNKFLEALKSNTILNPTNLPDRLAKHRDLIRNALGDAKNVSILAYNRRHELLEVINGKDIDVKNGTYPPPDEKSSIAEHYYVSNDQRVTDANDRLLPVYAVVKVKVDDIEDDELVEYLMGLDENIVRRGAGWEPLDRSQYHKDHPRGGWPLIRSVSPNWYIAGTPGEIPGGGPAGAPVPYIGKMPTGFKFKGMFNLPALGQPGDTVEVFILDTVPRHGTITTARDEAHTILGTPGVIPANFPAQQQISDLLSQTGPTLPNREGNAILDWRYAPLGKLPPGPNEDPTHGAKLACAGEDLSDHGTFIASIIHSIAPSARLHLTQILNDYAVGDAYTLQEGLVEALTYLPPNPRTPVLVNCSFGFQTPRPNDIVEDDRVNRAAARRLVAMSNDPHFERYVLRTMISCEEMFYDDNISHTDWVESTNRIAGLRLVIAAAGNDWHDICHPDHNVPRPDPRYPAFSDYVIGVGALDKNDRPTDYSNIADQPCRTGVWTFGGVVDRNIGKTHLNSGVIGMFINEKFPLSFQRNHTKLACWSGTSFSTAIITGMIACMLGQGKTPLTIFDTAESLDSSPGGKVFPIKQY